ncbi:NAD(P)-dependent oxidoreductase [Acetobacter papayae]|uniref:NAD(P)-dependent oxidoreductase n=1 Tax=Acetobacter papayae TaxID=1076592 RepID=UPI0004724954|nr:NAD(P)-dependent oxidoreductase [Acetobacter papayae]
MAPSRPLLLNQIGAPVAGVLAEYAQQVRILPVGNANTLPWLTHGADILFTAPSPAWLQAPINPPEEWRSGPRWVQIASSGIDGFPKWVTQDRIVTCGRGDAATPIAEYVMAALLRHERQVDALHPTSSREWEKITLSARNGVQAGSQNAIRMGTLHGRVLGLAGYGALGRAIAARARVFGMRLCVLRRKSWSADNADRKSLEYESDIENFKIVKTLAELFRESDHLVLAMPLTEETHRIVNADVLAQSRPGLHLINVARGGLIDQDALLTALDAGRPAFATLDVTTPEPLPDGHAFYIHPRVSLTAHVSWAGPEVRANLAQRIRTNLARYLSGEPLLDTIDPTRGY